MAQQQACQRSACPLAQQQHVAQRLQQERRHQSPEPHLRMAADIPIVILGGG
jgi:hypothetical protein